ncbi:hypothetical protein B0T19DRAFT_213808 [Cercophora scortea]|uniref:C2H2-type domain-containing protein n=1 Tax=Cercophora scortea TaxID=314031 RepID=A0AAE0IF10_9PEZI|nr:hypothetical protein B0T19DRAFT_213808 [Cercophora scortea]
MENFQESPDPFIWLDPAEDDNGVGPYAIDDFWFLDGTTTDNLNTIGEPSISTLLPEDSSLSSAISNSAPHNLLDLHSPALYWSPDDAVDILPIPELSPSQVENVTPSASPDTDWTVSPGSNIFNITPAPVELGDFYSTYDFIPSLLPIPSTLPTQPDDLYMLTGQGLEVSTASYNFASPLIQTADTQLQLPLATTEIPIPTMDRSQGKGQKGSPRRLLARERRKLERPSKCPICKLGHAYDADMRKHIRAKHPDQARRFNVSTERHRCRWCGESLARSDHLARHLKRKHSGS